jgi:Fe-S-cluster containining protein
VSDLAPKSPWYADGLMFACARCGNCCGGAPGYVWVSPPEIRAIAARLGMPLDQFQQQHTRRVGQRESLLELENGDCEFLVRQPDGATYCSIHPVRPLQCRTWPFWKSNLSSRRAWDAAAQRCPGMGHGEHHPRPVIEDALRQNGDAGLPL